MDTPHALAVVSALVACAPAGVVVGVGTVMNARDIAPAAEAGAAFALSPYSPPGMAAACRSSGILGVPTGGTPTEIYEISQTGCAVKLYPASHWNPASVKSLMGVGGFSKMLRLVPSGGIKVCCFCLG